MQRSLIIAEPIQQEHKLCGFLRVVLNLNSPSSIEHDELSKTLPFGTLCYFFVNEFNELGFRTEDNILLSVIQNNLIESEVEEGSQGLTPGLGKRKVRDEECGSSKKKNMIRYGSCNGNMSVVHQINVLKVKKCLEIVARIVGVSVNNGNGDVRVVVLIDIYLPIDVWNGWQFPKSGQIAASLFRHLSCDWDQRNSILVNSENYCTLMHENNESIWNNSECHILGCKVHCNVTGSSRKSLFELHEIFKNLPCVTTEGKMYSTRIIPENVSLSSGIWDITDDVLINVLIPLDPLALVRVASTCRHLRSLTASIMPCMKLKLFSHQQAAIEWMLNRERNAAVLAHPLYMNLSTEDGFQFFMHVVSGEIVTGIAPTVTDFRGGMFCDEPGLGKTITALSLILKTQGTLADPPDGVQVIWCTHNNDQRCGYYELSSGTVTPGNATPLLKRFIGQSARRGQVCSDSFSPAGKLESSFPSIAKSLGSDSSSSRKLQMTSSTASLTSAKSVAHSTSSLSYVKRNLLDTYDGACGISKLKNVRNNVVTGNTSNTRSRGKRCCAESSECDESWVQCDSCHKWRKLLDESIPDTSTAWFCSMNSDPSHQNCAAPEESWDHKGSITFLPGFCTKGTSGGNEQNVSFFISVLKENNMLIDAETKKALSWLSKLSPDKLLAMESVGLTRPVLDTHAVSFGGSHAYHKIFQAFGLIRKSKNGTSRWHYPFTLENMAFDVVALGIALTKPLDLFRLYLSRATLIVVPANLIDHWKTQIFKHVKPGQLRVYVWNDHRKPSAHTLAWDYDIVITTFSRLSAEWGPRKRSPLMQVHFLRVMLDEGHTLGSSLSLTNKLQMAISLTASNRWLLTGTPTPNTPNSQISHLQPLFKFLHEEAYGQNQKSWEAGILRPFEAEMEEGRSRLLQLLQRCMISARKEDLKTIPPCIKKVVFLDFTEEHARSYNELAVTVRRNILMADWNDPSHVESILNPKQWKFRSNLIRNVRLSCCVAGHIKVSEAGHDIQETMDILVEQGLDRFSEEYVFIKISLQDGCNCFRCKEWCRLPVITPCRHLLCLDCVAMDSEKCTFPGCGNLYEMQSPETLARPENPNPKWPVPKDLIELQPSYKQDDWDPDWHATSSSKVAYLIERLKALAEVNREMGYSLNEISFEQSSDVSLLPSQKGRCSMVLHQDACEKQDDKISKSSPEKVIIFSQFLEHIHVIEQQLTGSGIKFAGMYSPMHSSNKMKSLMTFQHDENCMALLMDGSAALGLDLSFVTHVFLMEPIWDGSQHPSLSVELELLLAGYDRNYTR
ncbi:F-box protein [Thalictrum thalictroides]|uniref:F-box protein n=1 Tax=Thalictrum thalictroides TaxID=46969 RepID=A0A7J6VHE6_THATH|nr:F-box protein [Thalictrum thalictroides]